MSAALSTFTVLMRAAWRGWRAKPFSAALNVCGLAIGVSVYLAVRIVNHSATKAFQAGIDLVAGRSDLEITAVGGVDETIWPKLANFPGLRAATPIVESHAPLADHPGEYLRVLGVDPFTAGPFLEPFADSETRAWDSGGGMGDWLAKGRALAADETWAQKLNLKTGSPLRLLTPSGETVTVTLSGTFRQDPGRGGSRRHAFLDIGWAQELLGLSGKLSSIQLIAGDPAKAPELAAALEKILPPGTRVTPPAQRNRQVGLMLQGFQLNLTALSLVSLLAGVFLIGNTVAASVVRQRREIGVLRAIGASRTQVRVVFLAEAAVSAVLGAMLGIPLARLLAGVLLEGVSKTISAHYVLLSIDHAWVSPLHVAQAAGCGLLAALAGAWLPAREASEVDPVAVLRLGRNLESRPPRLRVSLFSALSLLLLSGLLGVLALRTGPAWLSFGSCLALVLGFVMLGRPAARAAAWAAEHCTRGFAGLMLLRMGAAHLQRALHRAVPVIAALLTSVAMVLGVTIMIFSFRGTLKLWVDDTLKADLYAAPAANETVRRGSELPPAMIDFLRQHPNVREVETLREERVILSDGGEYSLKTVNRPPERPLTYLDGGDRGKDAAWRLPDHAAVSEILANRFGWKTGQRIELKTPGGPVTFTISGIFYDYADDQGCCYLTPENHARHWPGTGAHAVAVFLKAPARAAALEEELRVKFSQDGGLALYANRALRDRVFGIFDQTFAVTELLRVIAIAVALLGIVLALSTLVAERAYEIAALRSIGAGRGQVAAIHLAEAGLIGLVSAVLGMVCGLLLAMILTWVVNKAFFGWTVRFAVPWAELAWTPVWVTACALAAGVIPAWKAARAPLAAALRSE
ncbi:MAG: FtsX-like permease family protein [Verrucomicrobiota bacterium]